MAYPWEQVPWEQQAIDQLGPYNPGPYDRPRVAAPEPEYPQMDEFGQPEITGSVPGYAPWQKSRLGRVVNAGVEGAAQGMKGLAEGTERAGSYFFEDPEADRTPARGPDFMQQQHQPAIAAAVGSEFQDVAGDSSFANAAPPNPSITQDPKTGALIGSGHFNGEITPNASRGAFTGGPSSFNEAGGSSLPGGQTANWGTPDVSLAGMMNDQRARGMIQQGYEARNEQIDYPERYAEKRALEQAQLQKAQYEAADPYQLGGYAQKKAIDMHASAADRKAAMDEDQGQYQALRKSLEDSLRALESDPRTRLLPEAEKAKVRAQFQTRFEEDWDAYNKARAAARTGALPAGYLPRT